MNDIESWSIQKSASLYGVENWGDEYFSINERGNAAVHPKGKGGPAVDLHELVQAVNTRNIQLPVLFRFNDILRHRVRKISRAFNEAIEEEQYSGSYIPAYPIKVNQQRHVVEVLRNAGEEFSMGLEVGSKPELIAVMALHDDQKAMLLCNGYKDKEYIELALLSKKVGRRPIIIIEKYSEINLVLETAQKLQVKPEIGIRLRIAGRGAGRWERSGGDRAKFGLTISETLSAISVLEKAEALDCLKLIHFHIGSQLTKISSLRAGLKEASQVYVQLKKRCPNLDCLDIGGGLGVDYDGSKTSFESSMNYTVEEYARDVIWVVGEVCEQANVPVPNIITEAGRATSAHHSVLVFNVLGIANTFDKPCSPEALLEQSEQVQVQNMARLLMDLSTKNCQETLHDAIAVRNDIISQFNLGHMSIEDRALADECYWAVLSKISKLAKSLPYIPEDLERLPALLTDTYFCNLSIFQSLPDHWAIDQVFPVMPVSRLDEEPTRPVVLGDITCDSDGQIDKFPDLKDVNRYLPAHKLKSGEEYYFAAYLVGAYQEILGDLHNLFGDTNAIHVDVTDDGRFEFSNIVLGDTVREVLRYVAYEKEDLLAKWRSSIEQAVSTGNLNAGESGEVYRKYSDAFESYTYLEK